MMTAMWELYADSPQSENAQSKYYEQIFPLKESYKHTFIYYLNNII